jgi:hypothetical protein
MVLAILLVVHFGGLIGLIWWDPAGLGKAPKVPIR